jgi:SAM-dependent methyltransferase
MLMNWIAMHSNKCCIFCNSEDFRFFNSQKFEFHQCEHCKSISIAETELPKYDESYYSFATADYRLNSIERFFLIASGRLSFAIYPLLCGFTRRGLGPWLSLIPNGKIWLDYGAGNGVLTQVCDKFLDSENYFFDPYATSLNHKKIHEFSEVHIEKFDLITMSHCLEHSFSPAEDIIQASKLLASDGKLVLRIPVWSNFWAERRRDSWIQLDPPFHRNIPSINGIKCLLESNGFIVDQIIHDGTEFPWVNSFNIAGKLAENKLFKYLFRFGQGLLNYVKFSDQVTLIARKKY